MRTIVELPEEQVRKLADYCQREGVSRAEAIRRAVETMLVSRMGGERDAAFGVWESRGDARSQVDAMRSDWKTPIPFADESHF